MTDSSRIPPWTERQKESKARFIYHLIPKTGKDQTRLNCYNPKMLILLEQPHIFRLVCVARDCKPIGLDTSGGLMDMFCLVTQCLVLGLWRLQGGHILAICHRWSIPLLSTVFTQMDSLLSISLVSPGIGSFDFSLANKRK